MATLVGNFVKAFQEGSFVYCWIAKLFPPIIMFAFFFKIDLVRFFFLVFLGVNDYTWEIVSMVFVTSISPLLLILVCHMA